MEGRHRTTPPTLSDNDLSKPMLDAAGNLRTVLPVDVVTVTPTVLNNDAYDAGDVIFDAATITNAVPVAGGSALLQSIVVTDTADQKAQLHLVFMNAATSLGTKDSAPDIDDTEALTVLGTVEILAASYIDLGGASVATKTAVGLVLEAASSSRDLYVAAFSTGTPTYATGSLTIRFGFA